MDTPPHEQRRLVQPMKNTATGSYPTPPAESSSSPGDMSCSDSATGCLSNPGDALYTSQTSAIPGNPAGLMSAGGASKLSNQKSPALLSSSAQLLLSDPRIARPYDVAHTVATTQLDSSGRVAQAPEYQPLALPSSIPTPEEDMPGYPRGSAGPYLEEISAKILTLTLNDKAVGHPLIMKHVVPGVRARHDKMPTVRDIRSQQENEQKHIDNMPNVTAEIMNTSSDADESRGRGTVYVWYKLSGAEFDFNRESIMQFTWEKREKVWRVIKHDGFRGPAGYTT